MKMNWGIVGDLIGKAAPVIGGLVGGPAGGAAGLLVSKVLGCDNTPEAVEQELKTNPEAYAKLKAAQLTHKKELAELAYKEKELLVKEGIDHRKIDTEDKKDARERDLGMREMGYVNRRADYMIIGDVIGLLACLLAMAWITVQGTSGEGNAMLMAMNGPIGTMAGFFGSGLRDAHQFEFGSSRGSKEKDGAGAAIQTILSKLGK